jgi:hypothetical protein
MEHKTHEPEHEHHSTETTTKKKPGMADKLGKVLNNAYLRLTVALICIILLIFIAVKVGSEFLVSVPGGPYFSGAEYLPDRYVPEARWPLYDEHLAANSPVSIAEDERLSSLLY